MTKTLLIILKYRGTNFHGFARQPGLLTVQGSLEDALATLFRREIETVGAGRTDAGVHAAMQAVSFELEAEDFAVQDLSALKRSLNALTPDDMQVLEIRIIESEFSARFDAQSRRYCYRINNEATQPVYSKDYVWHIAKVLDWDAMQTAATHFIGEHDFIAFATTASTKEQLARGLSTSREIKSINFLTENILGERCHTIEIEGNAFLHSMVRTMVGTLVEIGQGKREPDSIAEILTSRDRAQAGSTAPAAGLMLESVEYLLDPLK